MAGGVEAVSSPPAQSGSGVGSAEQVTQRLPPEQRAPPPPLMLRPVVDQVASLAEGREVGICVVRGVVVPVRRSQNHPGPAGEGRDACRRRTRGSPAPPIPPPAGVRVPPAAIAEGVA